MDLAGYQAGAAEGPRDDPEDQHLLADLVPGLLEHALADRRRGQASCRRTATRNLAAAHNKTVVVDAYVGERNNKQKDRGRRSTALRNVHLYEPEIEWVRYMPKAPMLVLDRIFPEGILHPRVLLRQEHHPPADGQDARLHDHHRRDEERVRRAAQREAPLDARRDPRDRRGPAGDPAGDPQRAVRRDGRHLRRRRPGPARDALAREGHPAGLGRPGGDRRGLGQAAGLQPDGSQVHPAGHELGLGVGDPKEIEIVGDDISAEDWGFVQEDTFASKGQKLIYHGALKPFENLLLRSPIVPWSYFASNFYHNVYWYPFVGRPRVEAALDTKWGRLFQPLRRRQGRHAGHGAAHGCGGSRSHGRGRAGRS